MHIQSMPELTISLELGNRRTSSSKEVSSYEKEPRMGSIQVSYLEPMSAGKLTVQDRRD